ncbi:MAG: hypothetical protein LIP02_09375 [Bacteroidales bacterium]|nr:hypothetical protein [Bacteroidales bacterium]
MDSKKADKGCPRGKLCCHNWLADIPGGKAQNDLVEVQFKNTRKGFYRNSTHIPLEIGDWVAVEASPGHDIGQVTLTGELVKLQMARARVKPDAEIKRIFRKAKPADMEKFAEAKARENDTMIRSRKIASSLQLNMKIGDVEYQGDGNKAIFYYIADERVDFRQLIKVLAETFKVRIEMKQIGARQEAGRIGGIGPCGRPLCCASWMTSFVSVATSAARYQDISLNPQKLAGQCAKLKCCLNFEVDAYVESVKKLPDKTIRLETTDNTYYHFKTDIFKRTLTYSTDKSVAANLVTIDAERAFEVIEMNKAGEKPLKLERDGDRKPVGKKEFTDLVGQDSISRFDKKKKKKKPAPKGGTEGSSTPKQAQPQQGTKQAQAQGQKPGQQGQKQSQTQPSQKPSQQPGQKPSQQPGQKQGQPQQGQNQPKKKKKRPQGQNQGQNPGQNQGQSQGQKSNTGAPGGQNPSSPKPQNNENKQG